MTPDVIYPENVPCVLEKTVYSAAFRWNALSVQFSLVSQSYLTLCDPMDCSTPGFSVHHSIWVCSNSCPLSQWCHPAISSSVDPFSSCPQSLPASESFPNEPSANCPEVVSAQFWNTHLTQATCHSPPSSVISSPIYLVKVDKRKWGQYNTSEWDWMKLHEEYTVSDTGSSCLQLITLT